MSLLTFAAINGQYKTKTLNSKDDSPDQLHDAFILRHSWVHLNVFYINDILVGRRNNGKCKWFFSKYSIMFVFFDEKKYLSTLFKCDTNDIYSSKPINWSINISFRKPKCY